VSSPRKSGAFLPTRARRQKQSARLAALPAKLVPLANTSALARVRLFRDLDGHAAAPVIWLHAPGGAGKTLLLSSYARVRRAKLLWYEVDASDRDIHTFFHYLRIAAADLLGRSASLPALQPGAPVSLAGFARRFFLELFAQLPRDVWLVLDNEQAASEEPAWDATLRELIGSLPSGARLLISSRRAPPKLLARFRAEDKLRTLGFDALAFDDAEISALLRARHGTGAARGLSAEIARITRGWAIAVCLLANLDRARVPHDGRVKAAALEPIFDYLAGEIFDALPDQARSILLSVTFLPRFSPAMAALLCDRADAESTLIELARDQCPIERHADGMFSIHELFRAFLLERGRLSHSADVRRRLQVRAAELLADAGAVEPASMLLAEAEAWPALVELVERYAPQLASQSRTATIARALQHMPPEHSTDRPWLDFWSAVASFGRSDATRALAQRAFDAFVTKRDVLGCYLAWALVIRAIIVEGNEIGALMTWLQRLSQLEQPPPLPAIEARVALTELMAWGQLCIFDRDVQARVDHALDTVSRHGAPEDRLLATSAGIALFSFGGEAARARSLAGGLPELREAGSQEPLSTLASECAELLFTCLTEGDFRASLRRVETLWAATRQHDVAAYDASILFCGGICALALHDLSSARLFLERLRDSPNATCRRSRLGYALMRAWYALERADFATCEQWLQRCHDESNALDYAFASTMCAIGDLICASMRADATRIAALALACERRLAGSLCTRQAAAGALALAHARLSLGENPEAELAVAFGHARRAEFTADYFLGRSAMLSLCNAALELDVESDFAAALLRKYEVAPGEAALLWPRWPWEVRLRLLGSVEITIHGRLVKFGRKLPTVSIALLKLLAAADGPLARTEVVTALWPGYGRRLPPRGALDTAVYRLRKLLGSEAAIVHAAGTIALSRERCWSDVRALKLLCERITARAKRDATRLSSAECLRLERQLVELYRGSLADEHDPAVLVRAAERLQERYRQARRALMSMRGSAGIHDEATAD
jgi:LuxR family transcriptional regulator, maltose regulon positive regulatory protein